MVGNCERPVTEPFRRLKRRANLRDAVLHGHARVQVQFHAFEFAWILSALPRNEADIVRIKHQLARNLRRSANTLRQNLTAALLRGLQLRNQRVFLFFRVDQKGAIDGVSAVGE
ncbi:hypothetical protein SDC9_79525 [bioreactor metagenome]|uniref:Uncharacterized protein n=1 Tax=bioreactor metagenome TaxID=1076179 RepID=A0A644YY57_9ZZZZ